MDLESTERLFIVTGLGGEDRGQELSIICLLLYFWY